MISAWIGFAVLAQQEVPSPSKLLTTMFGRYYKAKTMVGSISLTQTAGNESGKIDTELQYERPAKLYIKQQMRTASGTIWIVTANGKYFSYDKPRDTNSISINSGKRLVESITNKLGTLDLGGIYAATAKSLGDRSSALDIAIARQEDLAFLKQQWATLKTTASIVIAGTDCWRVEGDWREYGEAAITGKFAMFVSEAGDLKRFMITESIAVNGQIIPTVSRWEVDLKVDAAPNPELFKLVL